MHFLNYGKKILLFDIKRSADGFKLNVLQLTNANIRQNWNDENMDSNKISYYRT